MPNTQVLFLGAGKVAVALVLAILPLAMAERPDSESGQAITLVKNTPGEAAAATRVGALALASGYREFGHAKVGKSSEPQVFVLNMHEATTITGIKASNDFHVSGGTCIEGHNYAAKDACSVEVTFTPKGPGHRTGVLTVSNSASPRPLLVPTGGEAYGPVVAFVPALIETVPTTFVDGAGLLLNAQGLAVDGGDNLYIADTGNELIRYQDSSGVLETVAGGGSDASPAYSGSPTGVKLAQPYGVAVDTTGDSWISDTGNDVVRMVGPVVVGRIITQIGGGTGSAACTFADPCGPEVNPLPAPYGLAFDASANLFLNVSELEEGLGYGAEPVEDGDALYDAALWYLGPFLDPFSSAYPLTVDPYDNLYYPEEFLGLSSQSLSPACNIYAQNQAFSNKASSGGLTWVVAGTENCGFSGDGGPATGAEISNSVQGLAWDPAGNLYFTDTGNNRVRRIDSVTGTIRTIGGNGAAAYYGDGNEATNAAVWAPTGIGVDSFGNVYTIAVQEAVANEDKPKERDRGAPQATGGDRFYGVVRKFGAVGALTFFHPQLIASPSPAGTILVSNVGNDDLNFTHVGFTSGNTGDFAIDPNTTSCNFTAPLGSGQNCLIGVIFTPSASGLRSAMLTLLDDTVTGSNRINVAGTGATAAMAVLSPTTLTFASQVDGTSSTAKPVMLSNTGGLTLTISSYTFTGTDPTEFSQTHTCGTTLAGGANCTIEVTFSPTAAGSPSATLAVATSAGTKPVTLNGTSTAVAKPKVSLSAKTNPAKEGQTVVLDSKVEGGDKAIPTGMVKLMEDSKMLSEAKLDAGKVTFKVAKLSAGTHLLTSHYMGDKLHAPAESPEVKQVVK